MKQCSIVGCDKASKSRGLCSAHYERWRLHGDPLGLGKSTKRKQWKRLDLVFECATCGAQFNPWGGRENTSKYCSVECSQPARDASVRNTPEDFNTYFMQGDGCWEWNGPRNKSGYGFFAIEGNSIRAHRYSYERSNGQIPEGLLVCHHCDNPPCVNPDHLFLGTHQDNANDMVAKGRASRKAVVHSEDHHLTKLTRQQVWMIRSDERPARLVAPEYSISKSTVWAIRRRHAWRHV